MRVLTAPDFDSLLRALAREVAGLRRDHPLRPLRIVSPGDRAREELRQALARQLGGTLAVDVTSWPRWVDDVATPQVAADGGTPLSEAGFDRLVARVLGDRARRPGASSDPLLRLAGTPGIAPAVAATLRDLAEGGFGAEDLDPSVDASGALVASVLRIHRAFQTALAAESLWDRRRREACAAERFASPRRPMPPTWFFGFHDLTPLQRRVVRAVANGTSVTLFIPGPGRAPEPGEAAATPLVLWARENGATVDAGERETHGPVGLTEALFGLPELTDPGPDDLELATFPTEALEVRGVARRVRQAHREGVPYDAMLVTIPPTGPAPLAFRRVFARAGIPLEDRVGVPRRHTAAGRHALLLARAVCGREERDREALAFLPPSPDAPEAFDGAARAFLAARDAAGQVERFRTLFETRFGEPVPAPIDELLDAITVVHRDLPLAPGEFLSALQSALATDREHATEPGEGAVLLASASAARFLRRRRVFHAGRVEGSILRATPPDPLLSDAARERINERHEHAGRFLALRETRREEQLLLARFAFESATERTVLTWSRRERTGSEQRNPAGLLLDVASRRAGRPLEPGDPFFSRVAPGDDPAGVTRDAIDPTDHDLALFADDARADEADLARLLGERRGRHLPGALRAARNRWCVAALTEHDGVLTDERALRRVRALLRGRAWSPTSLERLANCPFSFLLSLLRLHDDRLEEDDFSPLERGRLFHEWLERIHGRLLERGDAPLTPDRLPDALDLLDRLVDAEARELDRAPKRQALPRRATLRSLRDDVAILLARDAHQPESAVPVRLEMAFGPFAPGEEEPDGPTAPELRLPGGERVLLRGKVDRVDRRPDGALEVVDYKTGKTRGRDGEIRETSDGKPELRMQLPIYLEATRHVLGRDVERAYFSFATTERDFRRVTFTSDDLRRVRPDLLRVIERLLAQARDGWFPCTPGKACCSPDLETACGPGVVARFHRKMPELRSHLEMVRGPTGEETS